MRLSDLLEAPISDYSYSSYTDDEKSTFTRPERKILSSEKGKQRFIRAFQRTPFNFKVMFWNSDHFDANDGDDNLETQSHLTHLRAGIHDAYQDIEGEAGVITVIILGNLSPDDRIPMTPWILAHKIGHGFQDDALLSRAKETNTTNLVRAINSTLVEVGKKAIDKNLFRSRKDKWASFSYPPELEQFLTLRSKSAPTGLSPFEVFPEIIAQYLISGRAKLSHPTIDVSKEEKALNDLIYKLFKSVEGKVIVEL